MAFTRVINYISSMHSSLLVRLIGNHKLNFVQLFTDAYHCWLISLAACRQIANGMANHNGSLLHTWCIHACHPMQYQQLSILKRG
jgi:hypothetical protein